MTLVRPAVTLSARRVTRYGPAVTRRTARWPAFRNAGGVFSSTSANCDIRVTLVPRHVTLFALGVTVPVTLGL